MGIKCAGLEANYMSVELNRGGVHWGATAVGVRDSVAHNTGRNPTNWAAHLGCIHSRNCDCQGPVLVKKMEITSLTHSLMVVKI